jgi:hypothetical protein
MELSRKDRRENTPIPELLYVDFPIHHSEIPLMTLVLSIQYHMKMSIAAGKESQYSLINYMKGGKPFINLTTM